MLRIKTEPLDYYQTCTSDLDIYRCSKCYYLTYIQVDLFNHSNTSHSQPSAIFDYKEVLKSYECDNFTCTCQTHSNLILLKHHYRCEKPQRLETVTLPPNPNPKPRKRQRKTIFSCNYCPFFAGFKPDLKVHIAQAHMVLSDEIWWYKCFYCQYMTKRKDSLKTHMGYKHIDDKWYHCEHCPYKSRIKACVTKHQVRHTNAEEVTWYQCEHCDYKSKFMSALKRHVSTSKKHQDIRNLYGIPTRIDYRTLKAKESFGCDECSFVTERKAQLKTHKQRHHSAYPGVAVEWLECKECSYETKYKEVMRRHMMTHATDSDEIEWFRCEFCSFKTKFKSSLERHSLTKHHDLVNDPFKKHFLAA